MAVEIRNSNCINVIELFDIRLELSNYQIQVKAPLKTACIKTEE